VRGKSRSFFGSLFSSASQHIQIATSLHSFFTRSSAVTHHVHYVTLLILPLRQEKHQAFRDRLLPCPPSSCSLLLGSTSLYAACGVRSTQRRGEKGQSAAQSWEAMHA